MAMSWKVRHFLKQMRDQKEEEECKTKSITKKVTIIDTLKPTSDEPPNIQPPAVTHRKTESNDAVSPSGRIKEMSEESNYVSTSSPCFQRRSSPLNTKGKYVNWTSKHTELAIQPWCCVGDLISFCDKYEYQTLSLIDTRTHNNIVAEVKALLNIGQAPFDLRKRFPGNIYNPENLWVCISHCTSVEYHLKKMLNVFRRPFVQLAVDKQRIARQNFHLAVNELRLDISARISAVKLYDRNVFESEFHLHWQDDIE